MMQRKFGRLALIAASVIAILGAAILGNQGTKPPSIVFIIVDTLRADKLGVYGSPAPASKELDELARSGVVFEQAISQASWTRSSVASMLTGLLPRKTGVIKEKWDTLPTSVYTLPEALSDRGYETIGLTANPQLNRDFNFHQGFSHYVESTVIFSWMQKSQGKVKAGKERLVRSADEMLGEASRLVQTRQSSAPLYLQILLMDVHAHHRIEPDAVDNDLRGFPSSTYLQAVRNATRPLASFIREIDAQLGGDVIFVVTSDHGEGLTDHPSVDGSRGHGNILYRSQIHVPLIVIEGTSHRRFGARRIAEIVPLVDLMPTLLDFVESDLPGDLDGQSLIPEMMGTPSASSRVVFSETQWRPAVEKSAAVDRDWFYIRNSDGWSGTAPEELHPFWEVQDGHKKSRLNDEPAVAVRLRGELERMVATP